MFALGERSIGAEEAGRRSTSTTWPAARCGAGRTRQRVGAAGRDAHGPHRVGGRVRGPARRHFVVLDAIGNRIVAAIASQIELAERNRAMLKPPNSLDAWEAYHRGLWHMYRFNREDNELARHFFETRGAARPDLRARRMPACRSRISRTPSWAGATASRAIELAYGARRRA